MKKIIELGSHVILKSLKKTYDVNIQGQMLKLGGKYEVFDFKVVDDEPFYKIGYSGSVHWIHEDDLVMFEDYNKKQQLEETMDSLERIKHLFKGKLEGALNLVKEAIEEDEKENSLCWEEFTDKERGYYPPIYPDSVLYSVSAYKKLYQVMKKANGGWEPDWEDDMEGKYCSMWDFSINKLYVGKTHRYCMDRIIFKTAALARQAYEQNKELFHQYWMIPLK